MFRIIVLAILVFSLTSEVEAQRKWGFGVQTGLTFSKIDGPSEMGPSGESYESYSSAGGFNVGLLVRYRFDRQMGLQSGLAYNQKGTNYEFDGDSYFIFFRGSSDPLYGVGNRDEKLEITNSYLQIPLEFYYKINRMFEVQAGFYASLLVGTDATGRVLFDGESEATGQKIDRFRTRLGYNYLSDDPGQSKSLENRSVTVDGVDVFLPRTIGAYYYFDEVEKNYLRSFDAGLKGGLSVYLNKSLFFNGSVYYGLSDVTNQESDFSRSSLDEDNAFIFRDDKDRNFSIQITVGFVF